MWTPGRLRPIFRSASPRVLDALLDPPTFYQAFCEYEGRAIRLDGWQVAFLRRRHRFRATEKSVQIGFSWVCAMEALWMAFMFDDETSAFISINEEDAKEKVLYARKLYDGLSEELKRYVPLAKESAEELWLGARERPARLLSLPASSGLRGRATHVYLDEIDHFRPGQDAMVFTAAIGRTTRGRRRLTVGSSVFGEETTLSKIMAPDDYPDFLKFRLPWWVSQSEDVLSSIDQQRRNMPPEDFVQEYECQRADAGDATFPQNLIRRCWGDQLNVPWERLDVDGTFVAGFDPGGARHPAVLTVVRRTPTGWVQVAQDSRRGEELPNQEHRLNDLLGKLHGLTLAIDQGGVGMQMAQALVQRWAHRVRPVVFNEQSRSQMTLDLKKAMEDDQLRILRDRELAYQLNHTRRMPGGKVLQKETRRSHFDAYWALAMAASLTVNSGRSIYNDRALQSIDIGPEEREMRGVWTLAEGMWA
jgi:phage FluMu gp28-like protein